jgi:hypothetical protein
LAQYRKTRASIIKRFSTAAPTSACSRVATLLSATACAESSSAAEALCSALDAVLCVTRSISWTAREICSIPRVCCWLPVCTSSTIVFMLPALSVIPRMISATWPTFALPSDDLAMESLMSEEVSWAAPAAR